MNPGVAKKILKKSSHVDGWFSFEAGMLIALLDEFQVKKNITGNIFEIGVHHGKSSIFFSHLLSNSEEIHICDLFGLAGNSSRSGDGNKDIFLKNMDILGKKRPATIHTCLSSDLTKQKLASTYRMFHVDGGHNTNEALGDLLLASETLHESGVIILDDPFRVEWPGVTEAVIKFLQIKSDFQAIAVGFNKLILAKKNICNEYRDFVDDRNNQREYSIQFPWSHKQVPFSDGTLSIFFVPHRYMSLKSIKVWIAKNILKRSS